MAAEKVETLGRYHGLLNETSEPPPDLFHPGMEVHMFSGSPIALIGSGGAGRG